MIDVEKRRSKARMEMVMMMDEETLESSRDSGAGGMIEGATRYYPPRRAPPTLCGNVDVQPHIIIRVTIYHHEKCHLM